MNGELCALPGAHARGITFADVVDDVLTEIAANLSRSEDILSFGLSVSSFACVCVHSILTTASVAVFSHVFFTHSTVMSTSDPNTPPNS
jgi:hypothetical protein